MKTEKLPNQTKPKSVLDMTPYELATIEKYQNKNRGFRDNSTDLDDEMEDLGHNDNEIDW